MSAVAPGGRIDVHFHILPQIHLDAVAAAGRAPARGVFPAYSPALALELMDRERIATAITSTSQPGVHFGDDAAARRLARACNDYAADLIARHRGRIGAFATVPLPDVSGAIDEAAYALDTLGFDGIGVYASYGARFLGDPHFDRLLAALDERAAVVFVHPAIHPSTRAIELPWPAFMVEYPFDTTRAAVNLLFTGALERFPRIQFILAHAGGTIPFLAWRLSVTPMIDPRLPQLSREAVLAGLRRFWYDTALSPDAPTLGALHAVADPARILFGSDWPYANERVVAAETATLDRPGLLTPAQSAAIGAGNARALFPRFAK